MNKIKTAISCSLCAVLCLANIFSVSALGSYDLLSGKNGNNDASTGEGFSFEIDAPYDDFSQLKIDGNVISADFYSVDAGRLVETGSDLRTRGNKEPFDPSVSFPDPPVYTTTEATTTEAVTTTEETTTSLEASSTDSVQLTAQPPTFSMYKKLDPKDFSSSGSYFTTIVTIYPEYLSTLETGTYDINFIYKDGSAFTKLKVIADKPEVVEETTTLAEIIEEAFEEVPIVSNPDTGSAIGMTAVIFTLSGIAAVVASRKKK